MINAIFFQDYTKDIREKYPDFYDENLSLFPNDFNESLIYIKFKKVNFIYSSSSKVGKTLLINSLLYVLGWTNQKNLDLFTNKINVTDKKEIFFPFIPIIEFSYKNKKFYLKREVNFKIEKNQEEENLIFEQVNKWWLKENNDDWKEIKNIRGLRKEYNKIFDDNWKNISGFKEFKYTKKTNEIKKLNLLVERPISMSEYTTFLSLIQDTNLPSAISYDFFNFKGERNLTVDQKFSLIYSLFNENNKLEKSNLINEKDEYERQINLREKIQQKIKNLEKVRDMNFFIKKKDKFFNVRDEIDILINKQYKNLFTSNSNKSKDLMNIYNSDYKNYKSQQTVYYPTYDMQIDVEGKFLEKKIEEFRLLIEEIQQDQTDSDDFLISSFLKLELNESINKNSEKLNDINSFLERNEIFFINLYEEIKRFYENLIEKHYEISPIGKSGGELKMNNIKSLDSMIKKNNLFLPFLLIDSIDSNLDHKLKREYIDIIFENFNEIGQCFLTFKDDDEYIFKYLEKIDKNKDFNFIKFDDLFFKSKNTSKNIFYYDKNNFWKE